MYKLILDFGNTFHKLAVFHSQELIVLKRYQPLLIEDVQKIQNDFPTIEHLIFSSVTRPNPELEAFLKNEFNCLELTHLTPVPLKNEYQSPETLGKDRLAAAIGASQLFPEKDCLIIDAGSSITYDLVTAQRVYLGGAISPGLEMRLKALHQFTGRLPLIALQEKTPQWIGKTTQEAILSGVLNGTFAEVNGTIAHYQSIYPDLLVLFTGGDLKHFDKNLKNNIFAVENLVLQGLNFILDYNDQQTA